MAKRAETTVAECFLTSCVLARFQIGSHTLPGQRHSHPAPSSLGQGCIRWVKGVFVGSRVYSLGQGCIRWVKGVFVGSRVYSLGQGCIRWVKGVFVGSGVYACFGVTCYVQNDRGLLCATAVRRGWCGQRRVSTQS